MIEAALTSALRALLPRFGAAFVTCLLACLFCAPAVAQIILPGAAPSSPPGAAPQPGEPDLPAAPGPKPPPLPPKAVSEFSIDGKTIFLNGSRGRLTVERRDKDGLTVRLIAVGEKLSKPAESCGLDLGAGQPVVLKAAGRPEGVARFELGMPGCPVMFDTLDGGLYARSEGGACEFQEGDCRVDLGGVWGPPPSVIEGDAAGIEKDRARADKSVRESYKALIARVPKTDKAGVRKIAAEQAGFTSEREVTCRDYAREGAHGYCATRFTEYRAASLNARLGKAGPVEASDQPRPKPKPKSPVAPMPETGGLL